MWARKIGRCTGFKCPSRCEERGADKDCTARYLFGTLSVPSVDLRDKLAFSRSMQPRSSNHAKPVWLPNDAMCTQPLQMDRQGSHVWVAQARTMMRKRRKDDAAASSCIQSHIEQQRPVYEAITDVAIYKKPCKRATSHSETTPSRLSVENSPLGAPDASRSGASCRMASGAAVGASPCVQHTCV